MSVRTPAEFSAQFGAAFNSGSMEALMSLYCTDAVLVDSDGAEHRGLGAIADVLRPIVARRCHMAITPRFVIEQGDTAMLSNDFQVLNGPTTVVASSSFEVLHRDASGAWKLLLDHPYGGKSARAR